VSAELTPSVEPEEPESEPARRWPLAPAFALIVWYGLSAHFASTWIVDVAGTRIGRTERLAMSQALVYGSTFLGARAISRRHGSSRFAADFRLRFRPRDLPIGLLVGLGVIVLNVVSEDVLQSLTGIHATSTNQTLVALHHVDPATFWLYVATGVTVVPVLEELLFRGMLLDAMLARLRPAPAFAIVMATFGAGHWIAGGPAAGNVIRVASIAIGSFALTFAAWRSRRLGPGIVGHATNNVFAFALIAMR
jgi:membrane protease YdiL (CAAX protease family)